MVERITSRRSTLRTLPALREEALPRPWAQRMCCGVHTESSADRSEMGKIDRSRRRRGCAGALRHKICTASLDKRPVIDGLRGCVAGCTLNRLRTGLRWARSTEADGEGDVREPCDTKSAPPRLTTGLS